MFFLCFMNCESNEFVIRVVDACCSSARVQQGAEQSRRVSTGSVTAQSGSGGKDDLANFPSCAEALLGNLLALKSLVVVATRRPKHGQIVFLSSGELRIERAVLGRTAVRSRDVRLAANASPSG